MNSRSPSPEQILCHTAQLQSLARHLAVAPADADDAIQQTWLQSLRAGLPHARAWTTFLATTFRNLLSLTRRADRRRNARHVSVAVANETESTAVLVERLELHRHLVSLVLELPPRPRDLVLRHYFAGDSIAALAAESGTTAAAVRGHLHRAREQLRRRLEATGGNRALALLAAAATRPLWPIAASSVIVMKSKSLAIAALLLVAAFIIWTVQAPGPEFAVGADGQNLPLVAAVPPERATTGSRHDAALERTIADVPLAAWVVRGEVMHGSVGPLPSASFVARLFAGWEATGEPLLEATVVANGVGRFELALPPPSSVMTLSFAQHRSDIAIMSSPHTCLPGDTAPQDVMVFAFVKDCPIAGGVTDDAGQPIAGAWVKVDRSDRPTPCSANGEFRLMTSATYGEASLVAGAEGYVLAKQSVKVKDRAAGAEVNFRLQPALRLVGRVVDPGGEPIALATVHTDGTWWCPVQTDASGRFAIPHLDPVRERHQIHATHGDFVATDRSITAAQAAAPCELVLRRGAGVRGRVVDHAGVPVVGARIHLGEWIGYSGTPRARSAADGTFAIRSVAPGRTPLCAFARGHAPNRCEIVVPEDPTAVVESNLRLEAAQVVAGRVIGGDGKGLSRVRITPMSPEQGLRWQLAPETYTAGDGSFRLVDLPGPTIDLDCFGMEVAQKVERNVVVGRTDVLITMAQPSKLAGRVVDDATGLPVPAFTIRLVAPELRSGEFAGNGYGVEWARGLAFQDPAGQWATDLERFDEGAVFGVEAEAVGYAPTVQRRAIARPDPDPAELVLRLRKAARLVGRVTDRSGGGIAGARVVAFEAGHAPLGRDPYGERRTTCRTAADGTFTIDGASIGEQRLVVEHPDWPITFDGPFPTLPGSEVVRVVRMTVGARLSGTAFDAQGVAMSDAELTLADAVVAGVRVPGKSVRTDRSGRFTLLGLAAARYHLHGSGRQRDGSSVVWARHIEIKAEQDAELELTPAGEGTIELDLVAAGELPTAVTVNIWAGARSAATGPWSTTVSGPEFTITGFAAGDYTVAVTSAGKGPLLVRRGMAQISGTKPARVRIAIGAIGR